MFLFSVWVLGVLVLKCSCSSSVNCSAAEGYHCYPGTCGRDGTGDSRGCRCAGGLSPSPACDTVEYGGKYTDCVVELVSRVGKTVFTEPCSSNRSVNFSNYNITKLKVKFTAKVTESYSKLYNSDLPPHISKFEIGFTESYIQQSVIDIPDRNCSEGNQVSYRGLQSKTKFGVPCQSWADQSPHMHTYFPSRYPGTGLGAHSYCRNPGGGAESAWCFTTDPDLRWDYCDISPCDQIEKKRYYLGSELVLPTTARERCLADKGSDLALPTNRYEQYQLIEFIKSQGVAYGTQFVLGASNTDKTWYSLKTGKPLTYYSWDWNRGLDKHLGAATNGDWITISSHRTYQYICEIPDSRVSQTKTPVKCDTTFSRDAPATSLACETDIPVPALGHNAQLELQIVTKTGGYKDVKHPGSGAVTRSYFNPGSETKFNSYLSDLNPPVHCSLINLCDKGLWDGIPSILPDYGSAFKMDFSGWYNFDKNDAVYRYVLKIYSLNPSDGALVKDRTVLSRTYFSVTSSYFDIREGLYLVEVSVYDRHGNVQVTRKELMKLYQPILSVDSNNPVLVSNSFEHSWITSPDVDIEISWNKHFFISDFRYSDKFRIELPLADQSVRPEYDDTGTGLFDLSTKGKLHADGIVKFEIQWAKYWEPGARESRWVESPDLKHNLTRSDTIDRSSFFIRATDIFGGQRIVRHDLYVSTAPPQLLNLKLKSGRKDHDSVELGDVCVSFDAVDAVAGVRAYSVAVVLRDNTIISHEFFTEYCSQGSVPGYCQCNHAGICTTIPYSFCLKDTTEDNSLPLGEISSQYTLIVTTTNFANLSTTGDLTFTVDITPPVPGSVTKGKSDTDTDFVPSNHMLIFWSGFYDTETNITKYYLHRGDVDQKITTEDIVKNGLQTTAKSVYIHGLLPARSTRFCVVARNSAGLLSAPTCSTPVVYDTTPPLVRRLALRNTYTQPGLGYDGKDYWYVHPNATKSRLTVDCSAQGLAEQNLDHYVTSGSVFSDVSLCLAPHFSGYTLLLSPAVFDIDMDLYDTESDVAKVQVTASLTKGGHYYDTVMKMRSYEGSPDRVIIYHEITWYTPRFYINVFVFNKAGMSSEYSFGPCYFYKSSSEVEYNGRKDAEMKEDGLQFHFDQDQLTQDFEYRENVRSLEVQLVSVGGNVIMDYTHLDLPHSEHFFLPFTSFRHPSHFLLPLSSFQHRLVPNQELHFKHRVRVVTQLGQYYHYDGESELQYTYKDSTQHTGYVLDGAGDVDVDIQNTRHVAASWGGVPDSFTCQWAVSDDGINDNIRVFETSSQNKVSVFCGYLDLDIKYFILVNCVSGDTLNSIMIKSDGFIITESLPLITRPQLDSHYGADYHFLRSHWIKPQTFGLSSTLEYSILREKDVTYIPYEQTDTLTDLFTTALLPQRSNIKINLRLNDTLHNSLTINSGKFRPDATEPFVRGSCSEQDIRSRSSGKRYVHDSSRLVVVVQAKDSESHVSKLWVEPYSKTSSYNYNYCYTGPTTALLTNANFKRSDKVSLRGCACNGAGLCYSRTCEPLYVHSFNPAVPTVYHFQDWSGGEWRLYLADVQESGAQFRVYLGTVPFHNDLNELTTTSRQINIAKPSTDANTTMWLSVRTEGDSGLVSDWDTRQVQNSYLLKGRCEVGSCADRTDCEHAQQCDRLLTSPSTTDTSVTVSDIVGGKYTHSLTTVAFSWSEHQDRVYAETTVIDDTTRERVAEWKVVGRDTDVVMRVDPTMSESSRYSCVVLVHLLNGTMLLYKSQPFTPIVTPPSLNTQNPISISYQVNGTSTSAVVGNTTVVRFGNVCNDPHVPVIRYDVALGDCVGCSNILSWVSTEAAHVVADTSGIESGRMLFASVICYNEAGLGCMGKSEQHVVVDHDVPVRGQMKTHRVTDKLSVSWSGFYDVDSHVSEYHVQLLNADGSNATLRKPAGNKREFDFYLGPRKTNGDFKVRVTAVDLVGNAISITSDVIKPHKAPTITSCGKHCSAWPGVLNMAPVILYTTGGVTLQFTSDRRGDKLQLTWSCPAHKTEVALLNVNKNVVYRELMNESPTSWFKASIDMSGSGTATGSAGYDLIMILESPSGLKTVLNTYINIITSVPELRKIRISKGFSEIDKEIYTVNNTILLSWDPETVGGLCSGGTLHAGDVDIISDDRSIHVQNIVKDFSLIVTCKNVAGVVRSVKYAIKVDQKPKPDPNVTFQVQLVNPTPYLPLNSVYPIDQDLVISWGGIFAAAPHIPLRYYISFDKDQTKTWSSVGYKTSMLFNVANMVGDLQGAQPELLLSVLAKTPGDVQSDVAQYSFSVERKVHKKPGGVLSVSASGSTQTLHISWEGVFDKCTDCLYFVEIGSQAHTNNLVREETADREMRVERPSCHQIYLTITARQRSGVFETHSQHVSISSLI